MATVEEADRALAAAIAAVNKKYPGVMVPAGSGYPPLTRASWGNLLLDDASGGGFARGKIHRILGLESAGKSQALLRAFAVNQDRCHLCWRTHRQVSVPWCSGFVPFRLAWVDAEGVWDDEWSAANGIRIPNEGITPGDTQGSIYLAWPDHSEQALEIINILLESRAYSMVVLDSLAILQSIDEAEKGMDEEVRMGDRAKLANRGMRHWLAALRHKPEAKIGPSCFMLVNHLYANISSGPHTSDFTPAGRGQNYGSSLDLYLQRRSYMTRNGKQKFPTEYGEAKGDDCVKQLTRFHVRKSRICKPMRTGEYWSWIDSDAETNNKPGDVEYGASLFEYATRFGIMYKEGRDYLLTTGENLGTRMEEVKAALIKNKALHDLIVELITKKLCPEQYDTPSEPNDSNTEQIEVEQEPQVAQSQRQNIVVDLD